MILTNIPIPAKAHEKYDLGGLTITILRYSHNQVRRVAVLSLISDPRSQRHACAHPLQIDNKVEYVLHPTAIRLLDMCPTVFPRSYQPSCARYKASGPQSL